MPKTVIPAGYRPALGLYDTQKAIGLIKQIFLEKLCGALHLEARDGAAVRGPGHGPER